MNSLTSYSPRTELPELAYRITWSEWVRRWNECEEEPTAIGLLHEIFSARNDRRHDSWKELGEKQEQVIFLLTLADRHSTDKRQNGSHVRDKAFKMLADHFFKDTSHDNLKCGGPFGHELFVKLCWFFLDQGPRDKYEQAANVGWRNSRDTHRRHANELASAYLRGFCQHHWEVEEARDIMLEILYHHHALESLLPQRSFFWEDGWKKFEGHMEKLHELALRDAETIPEGVVKSSPAATLWVLASTALEEIKRQEEEKQARADLEAAQARIEKLKGPP